MDTRYLFLVIVVGFIVLSLSSFGTFHGLALASLDDASQQQSEDILTEKFRSQPRQQYQTSPPIALPPACTVLQPLPIAVERPRVLRGLSAR